ncbi:MAG: response regulator transcription factor [Elusimicrobiota bacterium]|jgi:DNA-binding response OmpR family regulator
MDMNTKELTVLVADDEPVVLSILSRCLSAPGRRVVQAADGREALDAVFAEKPDLVILDLCMPRLSGSTVCRALRENASTRDIPILVLTGLGGEHTEVELLEMGADDYLSKPFDIDELRARVAALVRRCGLAVEPLVAAPNLATAPLVASPEAA